MSAPDAPRAGAPPPHPQPGTGAAYDQRAQQRRGCAPVLVGCAVVFVIVLVGGGATAWWFVGRPIAQITAAAREAAQVGRLDAGVTNRVVFTPPAVGELTEAQVERYLAVLRRIEFALAGRYRLLEQRYDEVGGRRPQLADIPRLAGAYADLLRLVVAAKEAQVAALNAEAFSLEEYGWVRREVLRAAGLPGVEHDIGTFVEALATGGGATPAVPSRSVVPARNLALVERHRADLEELAFLAFLGL